MERILIVDDEEKMTLMISDYLKAVGYEPDIALNGSDALEKIADDEFDLLILDIMMPRLDGQDVLRRIRNNSDIPVIMLTARSEESDKVMTLDLGADDYLTKPFSLKELAARIRAVLRRHSPVQEKKESVTLECFPLVMDTEKRSVLRKGESVELTSVQFDLLKLMMSSPERVFTRMDLLNAFQNDPWEGYERTIDVHIKNIRKKIEENPSSPEILKTVFRVGYKLEPLDE